MKYLQFLQWLIALGPKLPQAFAIIERIVADVKELGALLQQIIIEQKPDAPGVLKVEAGPSAEELEAEAQVAQLLVGADAAAAFDGSGLRAIFEFLQQSGLLQVLIDLVLKWTNLDAALEAAAGDDDE